MRNVFVIGLGNFGYHLAIRLEGRARVTAVDVDRARIQKVGSVVARAIVGDGSNPDLLKELGVEAADVAVVSVGDSMEQSILITHQLKELRVPEIYAKAVSESHARILELIGATRVLQPEREVAENLAISLAKTTIVDYLQLHRTFGIIEVTAPPPFHGKSLAELKLRSRFRVSVVGIFRGQDRLVNPGPDTIIRPGDRMVVLGTSDDVLVFEEKALAAEKA
ncbi:MAG TPA: TrkA family potassium uptake protein [Acidobacteriota bacterium]|nr:TrkA family potassium uptake protein [Acidobacteriota bacterium]